MTETFSCAATERRASLLPRGEEGLPPVERLARFPVRLADGEYRDLSRLRLDARRLGRFRAGLRPAVAAQESLTRSAPMDLVEEGVRPGDFRVGDPLGAVLHILVTVDGLGVYADDDAQVEHPALEDMAITAAQRLLGLARGTLRSLARPRKNPADVERFA
ncbi:TetR family transcriptional regulator [Streptomyces sp. NRRL S-340]|uniref:TetR family transcriptional regulator n=1 Tax=Streptomyces sp. NRRL S-340 TaxID=1463901 RepID=UPI000A9D117C|nr:TetR family transcriptional regulator [Streptomyces sp. NRRL S-340]